MADGNEKSVRVNNWDAFPIIGLALLFDLLQFIFTFLHVIPIAGNAIAFGLTLFISMLAYISFGIWFALLRVNYFSGKKAALKLLAVFGTFVVELIPLIDALPAITAGVITIILATRIEDLVGDVKELKKLALKRTQEDAKTRTERERKKYEAEKRRENVRIMAAVASGRGGALSEQGQRALEETDTPEETMEESGLGRMAAIAKRIPSTPRYRPKGYDRWSDPGKENENQSQ